ESSADAHFWRTGDGGAGQRDQQPDPEKLFAAPGDRVGTLDPHLADLPWISLDSLISGEGSRPLMRIFGELATAEQVSEINNLILKNFSLRR
ncbi:hypothetical protein, partial [Enterobacter hormaechei]|uniref:hypothetical protein n=1 Tax=Enterobacter hormaechei TaxID=158836 RepID=UPI001056C9E2